MATRRQREVERKRARGVEGRERAVASREEAVSSRETATVTGARAVGKREDSASLREEVVRLREEVVRAREEVEGARGEKELLLAHLRQANENLVLESMRAHELAEAAEAAQRGLEASTRELHHAARVRELLIGVVGHDLRNPLNSIKMALQLLTRTLDPEGTVLAARLLRSVERMTRLIAQLLDFTRTHIGDRLSLSLEPTNLADLCRRIVEELELAHEAAGRFVCRFEGDLHGTWDPDRLAQVLSNLGANAIAHGARDRPIVLEARDEGEHVVVELRNDGPPIPPELLSVLFDPFRRAERKDMTRGVGLGLYISQQIVMSHGGSLSVRSSAREGTVFTMLLPRRSVAPSTGTRPPTGAADPASPSH